MASSTDDPHVVSSGNSAPAKAAANDAGAATGSPPSAAATPAPSAAVVLPVDGAATGDLALSGPFGPYRARYGGARPASIAALALPPARMPLRRGTRPLKQWRYVGVYGDQLMLCVGAVRVGVAQQSFWAVWSRAWEARLRERTRLSHRGVVLGMDRPGRVQVRADDVEIDLLLDEVDGVETVCPHGGAYAWTRKQGGVRAHGEVVLDGVAHALDARAIVDDSAGYHARRTAWRWSAGVGRTDDGRDAAWNLVEGINDPLTGSERTVWLDGEPRETAPARFAPDLSGVSTDDGATLRFAAEAVREREENMLLVRSSYRQPFGTFSGTLPGGIALAEGFGVMERHTALW
ncbi:DUF2804 family protein [Conexibacter sp. CPCC 206217]|uniref:DUF2804 family protein n=1 Tax=Conexibacter sp. CPCC 206217 TaxID=3064574 RepID=UPI0027252541|nr:DUF2804 family protein [Conexibacter sp. CPCC 206217]MDO8209439.1 DUF2804 family protein [Conexibacter sp. CPCC 206217]